MIKKTIFLPIAVLSLFNRISAQNVQFVHNCSEPAASSLKIWVNDTVWINSLSYKNATAQKVFAAGLYTFAVTGTTANSAAQALAQNVINVQTNQNHFIMLNGLVSAASPTPNGTTNPLVISDFSTTLAGNPSPFQVSLKMYHGEVTNSSIMIDIDATEMLINYNGVANPGLYTAASKTIEVDGEINNLGSYLAPLQNYAGINVNIVSSGGPSESFNLNIVPTAGGTLIPLAHIVSPVGINTNNIQTLYCIAVPNPARESVSIIHNSPIGILNCELKDVAGRKLKDFTGSDLATGNGKIDLSDLNSGIYFLSVRFQEGKKTIRLIRE